MNEFDYAYIAGFFDGEGDAGIRHVKATKNGERYPRLQVRLTQNDRAVLEWIQSEFGGSVYEKSDIRTVNMNHALSMSHRKARIFLTAIEPYLRVKKDKVSALLDEQGRLSS